MTAHVFLVDSERLRADPIRLDGDEGRHAVVVKRIRVGERVVLTDGRGEAAECRVTSVTRQGLSAEVLVRRSQARAVPRLVVVQAIPKGEHAERAVDLLTEVGADVIVPWAASRNVVTWKGDRVGKALHRWRATAVSAAKQSRRFWLPDVRDLHSTAEVAGLVAGAGTAFVLHAAATQPLSGVRVPSDGDVVLVIGPEGGITEEELATLTAAGAQLVRLGSEVLRSSSAGMAAAAVILSQTRWA
jgi:16S rRNA (uracil1498-N3)-methyltransferase